MRPTNQAILSEYTRTGSLRQTAANLGIGGTTLREWVRKDPALASLLPSAPQESNDLANVLAAKEAEIRDLRRRNRELSEAEGRREEWLRKLIEGARVPVSVPVYKDPPRKGHKPQRSIVLPLFDLQYGQFVRVTDTPFGRGGFSPDVFDVRLATYAQKVEAYLCDRAQATDFRELHIVLGGDLVEGDQIFRGQAWQLSEHPVRQVLQLRVKLGSLLRHLVKVATEKLGVEKIAVYCVPGNHGKVGGKGAGATPADYSWDYLVGALLEDDLREEPIQFFNEAAGAILFETMNHTFLTIHGDEIKGHAGIPFYGLAKADGRFIRLSEVIHDYLLMGHIHQPANIPNGSGGASIVSGDFVGANNLSRDIIAGSRPQQNVLLVSAKHGIVEQAFVYLDGQDHRERTGAKVYSVA